MRLPRGVLRTLLCLPDSFTGSVAIHANGNGVYQVEIRHVQRYPSRPEELIDLADGVRAPLGHARRRGDAE